MFVLINRKHLSYFAKSICIKLPKSIFHWLVESICIILQKVFVSNCKKDLYWFVESVCIILQNVFVLVCEKYFYKLQKVLYFFQKVFSLVCKKYFPFSREASCMLCNAGCQDLPCGKTSESRDCLFDTLTPSFLLNFDTKTFWIFHIGYCSEYWILSRGKQEFAVETTLSIFIQ